MTEKTKSKPRPAVAIEDDERHVHDVDDYIVRNRDALNASIRRSRDEFKKGKASLKSAGDVFAEGRRKHIARAGSR